MITDKGIRSRFFRRFLKYACIISVFMGAGLFSLSANAFDIRLGVGESGTFSHFAGRTMSRIITNNADDINCKIVPAAGDVHNLTNLRDGSLDIALIDSRMLYDALNKKGRFEFIDITYENLRTLIPLYQIPITLVVRSDAAIATLDDLIGKRFNAGVPLSQQHLAFDTIMQVKNWRSVDFKLFEELPASHSQDTMAFCHGAVQAMMSVGVHPNSTLNHLLKLCKAQLVNMDDDDIKKLIGENPAFTKITVPAGMYPSQSEEIATFGTTALLVASEDLDAQAVHKIINALYKNSKRLKTAHSALTLIPAGAAKKYNAGGKLHPRAVKFFETQK